MIHDPVSSWMPPKHSEQSTTPRRSGPGWRNGLLILLLLGLGVGLVALSWGLARRRTFPTISRPDPLSSSGTGRSTNLQQAFDILNRLDEFDQATAYGEIVKHLQQWWSRQAMDPEWSPDSMIQRLPSAYQGMVAVDSLGRSNFEAYDAQFLQEATWLRNVAQAVLRFDQPSPDLVALLTEVEQTAPQDHAAELAGAVKLFDWTQRHLQLDADVLPGDTHRLDSDVILQAWESLLFGRGTLSEKSRVFILLCRQAGLHAVMLAIIDPVNSEAAPKLWLPALLLGDQLYLFDMRWGIPVPGPDGRGVATLAQVVEHPELVERLELFPDDLYPVKADDLENVVALIDAAPTSLSQRMQRLESALVGENKLVLSTSPAAVAAALSKIDVLQGAGIWTLPYEGFVVRAQLLKNEQGVIRLAAEHSLFDRRTPLASARIQQFRGKYESDDAGPGARALYLECRASEQQISSVSTTPFPAGNEGEAAVTPTPEQLAAHRQQLAELQALMRRTKENASYWLGLMAFDRGDYGVSIDFLEKRLLTTTPDTVWAAGAIYNLGRSYEARGQATGQLDDLRHAQQLYAALRNVPLAAACHWRAKQLTAALAAAQPSSEPAAEPPAQPTESPAQPAQPGAEPDVTSTQTPSP